MLKIFILDITTLAGFILIAFSIGVLRQVLVVHCGRWAWRVVVGDILMVGVKIIIWWVNLVTLHLGWGLNVEKSFFFMENCHWLWIYKTILTIANAFPYMKTRINVIHREEVSYHMEYIRFPVIWGHFLDKLEKIWMSE